MKLNFTNHSTKRMQQRGISREAVKHIILCGSCKYDGRGAKIYFINKKERQMSFSFKSFSEPKKLHKQLNSYVVVCENSGSIITVGHRLKRRKN